MKKNRPGLILKGFIFLLFLCPFSPLFSAEEDSDLVSILVLQNRFYANRVLKLIRNAKESIRVSMSRCSYKPDSDDIATHLLEEVATQSKRGIIVEVVLDNSEENQPALKYLEGSGVRIFSGKKGLLMNCNMVIIDDFTSVAGTTVWTSDSINKNNELEFWIESEEVSQMLIDRFNEAKDPSQKKNDSL